MHHAGPSTHPRQNLHRCFRPPRDVKNAPAQRIALHKFSEISGNRILPHQLVDLPKFAVATPHKTQKQATANLVLDIPNDRCEAQCII